MPKSNLLHFSARDRRSPKSRMSRLLLLTLLVAANWQCSAAAPETPTSYTPYRFEPAEGWKLASEGGPGASRLEGRHWTADFSQGAKWIAVRPPDRVLLGNVKKLRLRVLGGTAGHSVHLFVSTHFMTFHKLASAIAGSGEQELAIDGPPGPGWQWFEGENDGKLHGPLRVSEIRLEGNGQADRVQLELLSLTAEGSVPENRRCVLTADSTRDGSPAFEAEVRCLSDKVLNGGISWGFSDWEGIEPVGGGASLYVPAGGTSVRQKIVVPDGTFPGTKKFIELKVTVRIPGQDIPDAEAAWVAKQPPLADDRLVPDSPFGMGIYLGRYRDSDLERTARVAREAGVKWSREDFSWSEIERERGRFDWTFQEKVVATAKRHGISVYAIVSSWPDWPGWTKAYTDEGIQENVRFLKELVRHFKGDIHQWEIWNEPNIFFWQGTREQYATLLNRSYAAIKEVDPSAQVLGLSTAGIDYNFIAWMMARDVPFDVLTIHPYRTVLDDHVFINELKIVSDLIRRPDGTRRPIWLTEMGWSTYYLHNTLKQDFQPVTLRENAQLLARSYLCSIVSGVEPRTFWYNFRNDGEDPLYFENELGTVRWDYSPKPSYYAFSTLARLLSGKRAAASLELGGGVFGYRFVPAGAGSPGEVIVLWNPAAGVEVSVPLAAARATLVNTIGEEREITATDGKFQIQLKKGAPVYLKTE